MAAMAAAAEKRLKVDKATAIRKGDDKRFCDACLELGERFAKQGEHKKAIEEFQEYLQEAQDKLNDRLGIAVVHR